MRSTQFVRVVSVGIGLLVCATSAPAATTTVAPGPGTPVQDAINAASPGDTILLMAATYPECITINKPLKLQGRSRAGQANSIVEAPCATGAAIEIAADGVKLSWLFLRNHADVGIDVVGRSRVTMDRIVIASPAAGNVAPVVNVQQSTRVTLKKIHVLYFDGPIRTGPAGIRIADVLPDSRIHLKRVGVGGFDVGLLLQDIGAGALTLNGSDANGNNQGIALLNVSGAKISGSVLQDNVLNGITVDAASTNNVISKNRVFSASGTDVADAGGDNCWSNNQFTTGAVPTCP